MGRPASGHPSPFLFPSSHNLDEILLVFGVFWGDLSGLWTPSSSVLHSPVYGCILKKFLERKPDPHFDFESGSKSPLAARQPGAAVTLPGPVLLAWHPRCRWWGLRSQAGATRGLWPRAGQGGSPQIMLRERTDWLAPGGVLRTLRAWPPGESGCEWCPRPLPCLPLT